MSVICSQTLKLCPHYQMKYKYEEKYSVLMEWSVIYQNILV